MRRRTSCVRGLSWALALVVAGSMVAGLCLLAGCSSSNSNLVFQNVRERAAWSSLGEIAYAALGGNGLRYIYAINENGGGSRLITPSSDQVGAIYEGGYHPAYSPNGTYLYFAGRRNLAGGDTSVNLFRTDAATGANTVQLTQDPGSDDMPSISPDGLKIAFVSDRAGGNRDIYVVGIAGEPTEVPTRLTLAPEEDAWPTWSPDGNRIYFHRVKSATDSDILFYDFGDTAEHAAPSNSPVRDEAPAPYTMPGSPDTLFLMQSDRAGDFDIWSGGVGAGTSITSDSRSDGFPTWEPGFARFAFIRDNELWRADATGGNQTRLTRRF